MQVRYRFPVTGQLRIGFSFPIQTRLFIYAFEADEFGVVTHLNATTGSVDRALWPEIVSTPGSPVEAHFNLRSPFFAELQQEVRAIAGMLSAYGLDDIIVVDVEESWLPANDSEKQELALSEFKVARERPSPRSFDPVSFDLVARAVLVADEAVGFETALNFYRKGRIDTKNEHYLDAILDYLFMIETTYANGKIKTIQVQAEYQDSVELGRLMAETLANPGLQDEIRHDARAKARFDEVYKGKTVPEVIAQIVNLRGELHHHSARKSGVWHPTDHQRFLADARFLEYLCLGIVFAISHPSQFSEKTDSTYRSQVLECDRNRRIHTYAKARIKSEN